MREEIESIAAGLIAGCLFVVFVGLIFLAYCLLA